MYLFYVYGAGFGHLNRIINFIFTQKIPLKNCVIITNSVFHKQLPKPIKVLHEEDAFFKDPVSFNFFIINCIKDYQIKTLIVDVFPAGFYGELEKSIPNFKSITTILLARILKNNYFKKYSSPNYDVIYALEKGIILADYQYEKVIPLSLQIQPRETSKETLIKEPYFLVVHSSPLEEVLLLYKQALLYRTYEHIYIYSFSEIPIDLLKENTSVIKKTKITNNTLKNANKIFTGCGFNTMLETKKHSEKQHILPFKRKYDDQFKRKRLL